MNKEIILIQLFCTVCQHYNNRLGAYVQRFSNNSRPKFSDEECITIYIFGIAEGHYELKAIHEFIKAYWSDWFPNLPEYGYLNRRMNALAPAFQELCAILMDEIPYCEEIRDHVMDSMPIIVANSKRSGQAKAAKELCNKGYCGSKGMFYYGVKLHVLGQKKYNKLPDMRMIRVSKASENDLPVAIEMLMNVHGVDIYADKMYAKEPWREELRKNDVFIRTPVKLKKGQKQKDMPFGDVLYSRAVSRARQTIESFFSWIQEKTHIQTASKVRSANGLMVFICSRIAALLLFYC